MNSLTSVDYLIFSLLFVISLLIGLHHALQRYYKILYKRVFKRCSKDSVDSKETHSGSKIDEYLIANGTMTVFPIALSLLASFFSATSLLGNPAEIYIYGIQYIICIFGMMTTPVIGAFTSGPLFARLKVSSVFEYLKLRFNSEQVRLLSVFCYLVRNFISSSLFIYGPATSLNLLGNISEFNAIIIIGIIGTFYTAIGGIRAVIWTDVFQVLVMFSGVILVITKGTIDIGGFNEVINISEKGGRLELFNFNFNPLVRQSFWSLFFGMTVYFSMLDAEVVQIIFPLLIFHLNRSYCIDQQMVQRFSSAKNVKTAQVAMLLNVPGIFLLMNLGCFSGLVVYATYSKCDPLTMPNSIIQNSNQLLPYFVIDRLGSLNGAAGLFLAAIFAGSLSSVSSTLNSSSAILWADFFKRFKFFNNLNDNKATLTTKLLVLFCGAIATGIAFLVSTIGGNLVTMNFSLNGAFNAPIIGVFLLASLFPFANKYGASCGLIAGFSVGLWLSIGSYINKPIYSKLDVSISDCLMVNTTSKLNYSLSYKSSGEAINLTGFNKIYSVSYLWFATIGAIVTVFVGVVVSLLTGSNKKDYNPKYLLFNCCKKVKIESELENIELDEKNLVVLK